MSESFWIAQAVFSAAILVLLLRSKDDYAQAVARKKAADRARRLEKGEPR